MPGILQLSESKRGVAGYDYDREGNLIAESTGEDNE